MALTFNGANIPATGTLTQNNVGLSTLTHNGVQVWKKQNTHYVFNNGSSPYWWRQTVGVGGASGVSGSVLYARSAPYGGYGTIAAQVDVTPYKTLTFYLAGSVAPSYSHLFVGVFSQMYTNTLAANAIVYRDISGGVPSSVTLDISGVTGNQYVLMYNYAGSTSAMELYCNLIIMQD